VTEVEWLRSTDSFAMLGRIKGRKVATWRKLRLFTCATLRRLFSDNPLIASMLDMGENFIEGGVTDDERRSAIAKISRPEDLRSLPTNLVRNCLTSPIAGYGAELEWWHNATAAAEHMKAEPELARYSAGLLHEIFHRPLSRRLPRVPPSWHQWNESVVPRLAQAIYDERAFDRMPILADALEDAGCDNAEFLQHCRQPGEHCRGCWVVDALLGKA
jgi:hypothetical protein